MFQVPQSLLPPHQCSCGFSIPVWGGVGHTSHALPALTRNNTILSSYAEDANYLQVLRTPLAPMSMWLRPPHVPPKEKSTIFSYGPPPNEKSTTLSYGLPCLRRNPLSFFMGYPAHGEINYSLLWDTLPNEKSTIFLLWVTLLRLPMERSATFLFGRPPYE